MATIALGTVGSAVGGPVGGFIGAAIGGYIDSQFILPWLFPTDPIQGPKLSDMSMSVASEGSPASFCLGQVKVGGRVIWMSDIKTVENTEEVGGKGGAGQKVTSYKYYRSLALHVCDTRGLGSLKINAIKKIFANDKVIWDEAGSTNYYTSIDIKLGNQTLANSLMQAVLGADNVPNYRGSAIVVIEDLALEDFGNVIPNLSFVVEQSNDISLGTAIGLILQRYGWDPAEYDVTRLSQCFRGMVISGPQQASGVLGPMLLTYGVGCQDRNGVLTFFTRGEEKIIDTEIDFMAASESGSDTDRPFKIIRPDSTSQPYRCVVKFISTDNDYQQGSKPYVRANYPNKSEFTLDVPIVLKPDTAAVIAKRIIWTAEVEKDAAIVDLPPRYLEISEGDIIRFTYEGREYSLYAADVTIGHNFKIHVEGMLTDQDAYDYIEGSNAIGAGSSAYRAPATSPAIMDCTSLHKDLVDKIGVYHAVCATSPTASWAGAALYFSADGTNYTRKDSQMLESTMGVCSTALADGPTEVLDTGNSLTVTLYQGTLNSCTLDELIAGSNRALVQTSDGDWELIGFQTATLVSTGVYTISNLLRGLRGTEHLTSKHKAGLMFVAVQTGGTKFLDLGAAHLGLTEHYKMPAALGNLEDYTPVHVELTGRSAKPFSPCNVSMTYDAGSGDYIFTWDRRTKSFFRLFGPSGAPYATDELPEKYLIEILASPGFDAEVLRSVTVSDTTTWNYTSTMQTDDGGSPGTTKCTVKIYQISTIAGKGTPFHGTFSP